MSPAPIPDGATIAAERQRAGLSQIHVAQALGIHAATLGRYEQGTTTTHLEVLERAARYIELVREAQKQFHQEMA